MPITDGWSGRSGRGWRLMIFCARATRGLRRPSLDARSGSSLSPHPWRNNKRAWGNRRGQARGSPVLVQRAVSEDVAQGMRSFLCSRNARPQKGLVRRPQSKAPHALAWLGIELEKKVRKTRAVGDHLACPQGRWLRHV